MRDLSNHMVCFPFLKQMADHKKKRLYFHESEPYFHTFLLFIFYKSNLNEVKFSSSKPLYNYQLSKLSRYLTYYFIHTVLCEQEEANLGSKQTNIVDPQCK